MGAEGFRFRHFHMKSCGMCFTVVYCLPDLILKSVSWVCIDSLEVVNRYEIVYFHVVMLYRKNDYRVSFLSFCNHSFIVLEFCFYQF